MYLDILTRYDADKKLKDYANETEFSISGVAKYLKQLTEKGFVSKNKITKKGKTHLSETKVKNVIILAAGWGSRLYPVTKDVPKPLVSVNGKPMLETTIETLQKFGYEDITVVTGKLKESFDYLKEQYGINLVHNELWSERENIHSLFVVRHLLDNTLILEGDAILSDESILLSHIKDSISYGSLVDYDTDEWRFATIGRNIVALKNNIHEGLIWKGGSYFNRELSKKMNDYFDNVYDTHPNEYQKDSLVFAIELAYKSGSPMRLFKIDEKSLWEIDTLNQLKEIDDSYKDVVNK